jgi:mono/diheme cytochrome c family protein
MKKSLIMLICASMFAGCYYDNKEDLYPAVVSCDTGTVTYSGKVLSIVQSNCYACHGSGNTLGNVNLDGYTNLRAYADNGKLVGVIAHENGFTPMPQGGNKLDECDISVVKKWISDGTQNN